jgi:hypothetical protein
MRKFLGVEHHIRNRCSDASDNMEHAWISWNLFKETQRLVDGRPESTQDAADTSTHIVTFAPYLPHFIFYPGIHFSLEPDLSVCQQA